MNFLEARQLLRDALDFWRTIPWSSLGARLNRPETIEVVGPSGQKYQIQVEAWWDDKPEGVIRVQGAIDDGGLASLVPLTDDFLLAPDGSFVGEAQR